MTFVCSCFLAENKIQPIFYCCLLVLDLCDVMPAFILTARKKIFFEEPIWIWQFFAAESDTDKVEKKGSNIVLFYSVPETKISLYSYLCNRWLRSLNFKWIFLKKSENISGHLWCVQIWPYAAYGIEARGYFWCIRIYTHTGECTNHTHFCPRGSSQIAYGTTDLCVCVTQKIQSLMNVKVPCLCLYTRKNVSLFNNRRQIIYENLRAASSGFFSWAGQLFFGYSRVVKGHLEMLPQSIQWQCQKYFVKA